MSGNFPEQVPPTKIAYISGRPRTLHLRMCKLVRTDEDGHVEELIFDQSTIHIGAMADNDIVIDDDTASRYHCKIIQTDGAYLIRDEESTNGTFVNRVHIREAYLQPGNTVTVGKTELRFHTLDEQVEIQPSTQESFGDIVGKSVRIRELFGILEKIAPTGVTVIIEGETGTGKEVVAKTIHAHSSRRDKPFIVIDCGAVPESLIESELFGHEKGSFTGAIMSRQGLFEMAQGGTIFLDELGELGLDLQPKLLRALEQREIRRVGSNKSVKIDVRVVAATNRNLEEEVKAGRFREDLYYRLSVVRLILPPLRDRKEDIPLLIKHFLHDAHYNKDANGKAKIKGVNRDAVDAMVAYSWPGNVRELVNVVERACSFAEHDYIHPEDLPENISGMGLIQRRATPEDITSERTMLASADTEKGFKEAKEEWLSNFEKDYIAALLKKNNHNISHAAREADIDRKYFRKLMKKYELDQRPD